jgi:hypothetical protein
LNHRVGEARQLLGSTEISSKHASSPGAEAAIRVWQVDFVEAAYLDLCKWVQCLRDKNFEKGIQFCEDVVVLAIIGYG